MEYFDVIDEMGNPTGEIVERNVAHTTGVRHRTSHVWIFRKRDTLQVLLQKRSFNKDSFPGCYDISTAGHIPAGCGFIESAIREAKEELGIDLDPDKLIYCGTRKKMYKGSFHDRPFIDNQISNVYAYFLDQDDFIVQKSEIESVVWMDFSECVKGVVENTFSNCIALDELGILIHALDIKNTISLEKYL